MRICKKYHIDFNDTKYNTSIVYFYLDYIGYQAIHDNNIVYLNGCEIGFT